MRKESFTHSHPPTHPPYTEEEENEQEEEGGVREKAHLIEFTHSHPPIHPPTHPIQRRKRTNRRRKEE